MNTIPDPLKMSTASFVHWAKRAAADGAVFRWIVPELSTDWQDADPGDWARGYRQALGAIGSYVWEDVAFQYLPAATAAARRVAAEGGHHA